MRRHRRIVQPAMPNTLEELGQICYDNPRYGKIDDTYFCRGTLGEGDTVSVLFFAEGLTQMLSETKEIHIDGTFKTRPRHPISSQLLTIMAVQYGHAFPCAFALMKSRKTEAYNEVFQKLKELAPNMRVKLIMTDFEKPLICSLDREFPNVHKAGCFFHYGQAILRKACSLGMKNLLRDNRLGQKSLKLLICIALLPAERIADGFQYVVNFVGENQLANEFETLLGYHRRQWLTRVGAESISVYKRTRRTNNDSESLHSMMQRLLRVRGPNVWEFVDKIRDISNVTIREIRAFIEEGLQIKVVPRRSYRLSNQRIKDATARFDEDGDVGSFLNSVSYTVAGIVQSYIADDQPEEIPEEEALLGTVPGHVPPEFEVHDVETQEAVPREANLVEIQEVPLSPITPNMAPIRTNFALCLVCQDAPPTTLLMPCRHFGMCTQCSETMQNMNAIPQIPDEDWGHTYNYGVCPLDRVRIEQYVTVINT